jgi:hypothetical protein
VPGIESARKKCREEEAAPVISKVDPNAVLASVFKQLGKPRDLSPMGSSLTRATPISPASFRVQIYRDTPHATLTDSFFVHVNGEGDIVRSIPAINLKYGEN